MKATKLVLLTALIAGPYFANAAGKTSAANVQLQTTANVNASAAANLKEKNNRYMVDTALAQYSVGPEIQTSLLAAVAGNEAAAKAVTQQLNELGSFKNLDVQYKNDAAKIIAMQVINNKLNTDEFSKVNIPAFLKTVGSFTNNTSKQKALKLIKDIAAASSVNVDLSLSIGTAKDINGLKGKDICASCPDACGKK